MSLEAQLNQLKQTAKSTALITHRDDTDDQLRDQITANARAMVGVNNTAQGLAEGYRLMGESEACSQLLSERRQKQQAVLDARRKWHGDWEKRKKDALLRLEQSCSPNGQLIAAILEEEGETCGEDLLGWCEELASLDEDSGARLLRELTSEGLIEVTSRTPRQTEHEQPEFGQFYRLLGLCSDDLTLGEEYLPLRIDSLEYLTTEEQASAKLICRMMRESGEPLSPQDCAESLGNFQHLRQEEPYCQADFAMDQFAALRHIRTLCKEKILSKQYSLNGTDYYWFHMLGEGGSKA